jgi:hypothetical protein
LDGIKTGFTGKYRVCFVFFNTVLRGILCIALRHYCHGGYGGGQ